NIRCIMCPNQSLSSHQTGHMPIERFQKIVDDIGPYVNNISICHRGEPLLHKGLCEMIEYCSGRGLNTSIHTNAVLLTEDLSHRLIRSGLSAISFSFDGYTKKAYESIRVGSKFEAVLTNIRQFLRIKREMKSKSPHTTIQIIEFESFREAQDVEQKQKFIQLFDGLPVDRIYVKRAHN
ncbi:radical SAM protein, partial [Candidatus Bathyarchaeota archaeon]|nr:radical SAM protein [Candidatus Bathyarchaeota archaeon]